MRVPSINIYIDPASLFLFFFFNLDKLAKLVPEADPISKFFERCIALPAISPASKCSPNHKSRRSSFKKVVG